MGWTCEELSLVLELQFDDLSISKLLEVDFTERKD